LQKNFIIEDKHLKFYKSNNDKKHDIASD